MDGLHGAFAPVPTPLAGTREFDSEALSRHLRWLAEEGLDGVLILGTNGEFPSFSMVERERIAEAAASVSGLKRMLGVGSCALPEVVELAAAAAKLGFVAVVCPPPYYYRSAPHRGLADFFRALLDKSPIPVILYHIPQITGIPISERLLDLVGDHPNLAGVKDSSGDPQELRRLVARFAQRSYFVGNDRLATECVAAGGRGSITAGASVAPRLVVNVRRGEADQIALDRVRALLEEFGLGPSVKAILRRCGLGTFATRPPLLGIEASREPELWKRFCELVPEDRRPRSSCRP